MSPYRSARQRAYLHAKHPRLAAKWDRKYGGKTARRKRR
jgi:hypothetical protein